MIPASVIDLTSASVREVLDMMMNDAESQIGFTRSTLSHISDLPYRDASHLSVDARSMPRDWVNLHYDTGTPIRPTHHRRVTGGTVGITGEGGSLVELT